MFTSPPQRLQLPSWLLIQLWCFGYKLDLMMEFGIVYTDSILDRTSDIVNTLTFRFFSLSKLRWFCGLAKVEDAKR